MRIRWPHSIVEAQLSDYSGKCEEPLPAVNPQTEVALLSQTRNLIFLPKVQHAFFDTLCFVGFGSGGSEQEQVQKNIVQDLHYLCFIDISGQSHMAVPANPSMT